MTDSTQPDPQTALPQTEEWSNAPTDQVGLTDDQVPLDESGPDEGVEDL